MRFSKYLVAAAMAFFTLTASSQSSAVRGVVVDAQGEAIIGATIKLKNGKALGATDVDGRFTLSSVKPGEKIEITYVGMKPQVVTVSSNMKITLVSDEQLLEEVVVTAFGEQKRSAFAGSAAVVQAKTIETKQLTNVMSALQGEAAGVQMVNNSDNTNYEDQFVLDSVDGYVAPWMNYFILEYEYEMNPNIVPNPDTSGCIKATVR